MTGLAGPVPDAWVCGGPVVSKGVNAGLASAFGNTLRVPGAAEVLEGGATAGSNGTNASAAVAGWLMRLNFWPGAP